MKSPNFRGLLILALFPGTVLALVSMLFFWGSKTSWLLASWFHAASSIAGLFSVIAYTICSICAIAVWIQVDDKKT